MKVSSPELPSSPEHEPSEPPDERALFSRLAASMARHRRAVIITWLVVAFAAAPLALTLSSALSGAGWEAQGSIAQLVRDELRQNFAVAGRGEPDRRVPPVHADHRRPERPRGARGEVRAARRAPTGVVDPLSVPPRPA